MSESLWYSIALVFLLPLAFAALWTAVLWSLAWLGGWRALAKHYAVPRPLPQVTKRWVSGMLSWVGYNHVLIVGSDARYLYLDVLLPFRPGHPALRIPWSDIHRAPAQFWLLRHLLRLQIGSPALAFLSLPNTCVDQSRLR